MFFGTFFPARLFTCIICSVQDKHEFVVQRIHKLAQAGVTNALVCLSGTESCNSRELICRVFLALATEQSLRGLMVQQGAVKVLLLSPYILFTLKQNKSQI